MTAQRPPQRIDVHIYHHGDPRLARIERKVDTLITGEVVFMSEVTDALADLQLAAQEDRDADSAAIGVLQGLAAKVDELVAAQGDTVSAADLTQLATDIRTSSAGLVEAANANTR